MSNEYVIANETQWRAAISPDLGEIATPQKQRLAMTCVQGPPDDYTFQHLFVLSP